MAFELPKLPYAQDALEPYYSERTLSFHHGKHHQAYVTKTNDLVSGTELEGKSIEDVIRAAKSSNNTTLFNQSAQVWNHTFFWHSMKPGGGGKPTGDVASKIDEAYGSHDKFVEEYKAKAAGNFGSGWTWLVLEGGKVKIVNTDDADTPLVNDGQTPLLTIDVWEHAYYLDYQNRRPDFVQAFFDHLVNWDFVNENLSKA
ncbi:superoxide dismutase [Fodinicurvata fenggangensis]|uniref:superoxide dismutase n=1 Tax=Fodinicurvata fenggangensis TaxID=1121830 RepID=UPI00047C585A|nr:superoxide dismutase [Fodinicurvata fenggangensis]